jgi:hypothetical protein
MCAIVNGPLFPKNDAYIEWHWIARYDDLITTMPVINSGKFIFVASAAYINQQVKKYGYGGISSTFGIGMFNPSNHNS